MILILFVPAVVVVLVIVRRRRQRGLSGTLAAKPVFSVEPPRRRMSPLKGERL